MRYLLEPKHHYQSRYTTPLYLRRYLLFERAMVASHGTSRSFPKLNSEPRVNFLSGLLFLRGLSFFITPPLFLKYTKALHSTSFVFAQSYTKEHPDYIPLLMSGCHSGIMDAMRKLSPLYQYRCVRCKWIWRSEKPPDAPPTRCPPKRGCGRRTGVRLVKEAII